MLAKLPPPFSIISGYDDELQQSRQTFKTASHGFQPTVLTALLRVVRTCVRV